MPAAEPIDDALAAERPRLLRLARHLVHDAAAAEDATQETLARAWSRRDQLRAGDRVAPWLNRILLNLVIDRARARRDELDLETVEERWRDDHYSVDPVRVLEQAEARDQLEDGLARLPAAYRVVVVLHDAADWPVREIAGALEIGLPAAKQRLRRGRMMLVSALDESDPRRQASLAQPMRCWQARSHISAYLDEELHDGRRRAIEEHLATCPTCPPLYASLVGVREAMGRLRDPDSVVPPKIAERIGER